MSKVGDIIEKDAAIPDDVTGVQCGGTGSRWRLTAKGHWHLSTAQVTRLNDACGVDGYNLMRAACSRPLTVTAVTQDGLPASGGPDDGVAVRRPEPAPDVEDEVHYYISELRPGTTFCGIALEEDNDLSTTDVAGKATCETCRAEADEDAIAAQRADPADLIALVRQYGQKWHDVASGVLDDSVDGAEVGGRISDANVLFERISTEVARLKELVGEEGSEDWQWKGVSRAEAIRQANEFHARAQTWMDRLDTVKADRDEARAQIREEIEQADEHAAWAERLARAAIARFDVRLTEEGGREVWEVALDALTATSGPSVLSLPQVPRGTIELVGSSGDRYTPEGGFLWWRSDSDYLRNLGVLLVDDGPLTPVMREPRTWPKLDGGDDLTELPPVVEVDGTRYRRSAGSATYIQALTGGMWGWWALRGRGDVTEVFEDEQGGAS